MGSEIALFATLAAIAFLAGFIHSAIGFGFGIVAISLLPFVVDARSAHVIVSVSSVPMLIMAAWAYRDGIEWSSLKQALLGAAIFLPIGFALFEWLPLDWLVRGTGLAILAMVLMSLRGNHDDSGTVNRRGACFTAGAAAGFLAGAVSIAGPPVAAFALKQNWDQSRYKAFVTQCLLVIAFYKASLLVARGHLTSDSIYKTVIVAVVSIAGVQLGVLASKRIAPIRFRRLVAGALIAVSCLMMWRGQPEEKKASVDQLSTAHFQTEFTTGFHSGHMQAGKAFP
ncbi:MAG: sulfite exporter TauE/SafE family protein [Rubripirellula sp.]